MTEIILLLHVLSAIVGLGMLAPDLLLTNIYREATTDQEKIRLARLHLRMTMTAQIAVLMLFLTGSFRAEQAHYGWFKFSVIPWLATKQVLIIVLLALVAFAWSKVRKVHRALGEQGAALLPLYEQNRWRSHLSFGLALIMAILGVLKPG
jgi:hypothetical protein